jgi:hypothetical protein
MIVCGKELRVRGRMLRIAELDGDKYRYIDDPRPIIEALRKENARIDLFTFMQRLPETTPKFDYPMEWDNLAVISVSTYDQWWNEQIGFKARNKAKQAAKKGVVVREVGFDECLVEGIWEIYNECPVRQGRRFTHYGKDVQTVYREEATFPDSSIFLGAYFDDKLIGFVKLVYDEMQKQAGLMNIVSMIKHRDKAPTNALVAEAVRVCADRGISYLVYSNFAYGSKQKSSITDFKERNAFKRVDLPRYYVPLTSLGSVALRLQLHRPLVSHVPESIAAKLREARDSWYNRKLQISQEA